ncbi:MAG TPA: hypothetical protein VNG69_17215 [Casimicrobiaceae bacterium]|nr:hypothetical protein [Casimicrobiaceae bacterium]
MADSLPQSWEIDYEDLGNVYGCEHIQSCNACLSMALCVWPCNCYERDSRDEPDLVWNLDMCARVDLADAWAIIGPVNWYAPSSNLKLMFDRLVCASGGNPREDLIEHKNPELRRHEARMARNAYRSTARKDFTRGSAAYGINRDITLTPKRSEGEKLRDD